ncbi:MAG: hypothetical protein AAFZ91_12895 [Pseudomonadota bacterium]
MQPIVKFGAGCLCAALTLCHSAQADQTFQDRLDLNVEESCSAGMPEPGDVVALALRGAKGKHYVRAGSAEKPRLAIRGEVSSLYSVFQIEPTETENAVAFYNLGQQAYVLMDEDTRLFANAQPTSALLFDLEAAQDGYVRIKVHGYASWVRMNANGYLYLRARQEDAATQFCAQGIATE